MIPAVSIVYIIGFMGSGKSTVGKKIAGNLKWHFVDLDSKIESFLGMSIADVFQQKGEDYFRAVESQVLRELKPEKETIISTGGGTPCSGSNMEYMLETGLTIYLKLTPEQLAARLSSSGGRRPLINNIKPDALPDFIAMKLTEREKWYNRSDLVMDGCVIDYQMIISLIKNRFH